MIETAPRELNFSPAFSPGIDAALARYVDLGKSGAGKSNVTAVKAETIARFVPFWQFDPLGNLYGMRSNAAGDGPGLPMVIFGGVHGDLPLHEPWQVVKIIVDERLSAIFDLSELEWDAQQSWAKAWCESILVRAKAAALSAHVAFDEADRFAPNAIGYNPVKVFARTARNYGIGWTFSTQRPQILSPDVIESANVIVAMRMPSGLAQESVGKKIAGVVGKRETAKLIEDLPTLKRGECWFIPESDWLPDRESSPVRFVWRLRETFDSTKPRRIGESIQDISVQATVDVEKLRELLGPVAESGSDKDDLESPQLRERVAELEAQVADLEQQLGDTAEPMLSEGDITELYGLVEQLDTTSRSIVAAAKTLAGKLDAAVANAAAAKSTAKSGPVRTELVRDGSSRHAPLRRVPVQTTNGNALSGPDEKFLTVLWRRAGHGTTRRQLGALAGYSPKSSTFANYVSSLRVRGYVNVDASSVAITDAGRKVLGKDGRPNPITRAQLLDAWCEILGGRQAQMLRILVEQHPRDLTRSELAERSGLSPTSSTFANYVSELKTNGLALVRSGVVKANAAELML